MTTLADTERALLMAWWNADWPDEETHVIDLLGDVLDQIIDARLGSGEVVEAAAAAIHAGWFHDGGQCLNRTQCPDETSRRDAAAAVEAVRAALREGE